MRIVNALIWSAYILLAAIVFALVFSTVILFIVNARAGLP